MLLEIHPLIFTLDAGMKTIPMAECQRDVPARRERFITEQTCIRSIALILCYVITSWTLSFQLNNECQHAKLIMRDIRNLS